MYRTNACVFPLFDLNNALLMMICRRGSPANHGLRGRAAASPAPGRPDPRGGSVQAFVQRMQRGGDLGLRLQQL